jgi:hypothetical protein
MGEIPNKPLICEDAGIDNLSNIEGYGELGSSKDS